MISVSEKEDLVQPKEADFFLVVTTTDSRKAADSLARALVEKRLAACVQVDGPLTSFYRWDGEMECSTEYRVSVKTTASARQQVMDSIGQLHSYDVPQVICLPIVAGEAKYLGWIEAEVFAEE